MRLSHIALTARINISEIRRYQNNGCSYHGIKIGGAQ